MAKKLRNIVPINWDIVPDKELIRQQIEILHKYPKLIVNSANMLKDPHINGYIDISALRKILKWCAEVDIINGDDDIDGDFNWSYIAKHVCERDIKMYVHNSELIMGAIMCGYVPDKVRQTNCSFKRGWWYE